VPDLERLDLVVGATAPSIARIEDMAVRDPRLSVTVSADDMASRMLAADVAVGAVGSTSWERAALGLPTLGIVLADNQAPVAAALADAGALILLGDVRHTPLDHVGGRLRTAMNDPTALRELSLHASKVCDGRGVDRVISEIEKLIAAGRTVPSLPPSRPR
jgi:spore coat polysaccharide biosynthesis predicted glycosyltransferase SpsG